MPKLENDFKTVYQLYAPSGVSFNEYSKYLLSRKTKNFVNGNFYRIYNDLVDQNLWYFSNGVSPAFHEFFTHFIVKSLVMDKFGNLPKKPFDLNTSAGLVKPWAFDYPFGADVETSAFFIEVETGFKHELYPLFSRLKSYSLQKKEGYICLLNPARKSAYSDIVSCYPNFPVLSCLSLFSHLSKSLKIRVSLNTLKRRFEEETRQTTGYGFSARKKF